MLCERHTALEVEVNECLICYRPLAKVNRAPQNATSVFGDPASLAHEVAVEAIGIEWCVRCHELGNRLEAGIEGVVSRLLVGIHLATPETLAVEAHVPVAQFVLSVRKA